MFKRINYSLITALAVATSADPHVRFLPVAQYHTTQMKRCKTNTKHP